jgi:predicted nucleic acid-binding protein
LEANRISEQLDEIADFALRVDAPETLSVIAADPDDDRVLECAVAGECSFIVTGDKHLLVLGTYANIRILKVTDFLEILNSPLEVG